MGQKGVGHGGSPVHVRREHSSANGALKSARNPTSHKNALWRLHQAARTPETGISDKEIQERSHERFRDLAAHRPGAYAVWLDRRWLPLGRRGAGRFSRNAGSVVGRHPEGIAPILDQSPRLRRARLFRARRRQIWMANLAQTARSAARHRRVRSARFACGAPPPLCANGRDPDFRVRRLCLAWTGLRLWIRQAELWRRLESAASSISRRMCTSCWLTACLGWPRCTPQPRSIITSSVATACCCACSQAGRGRRRAPHVIATAGYKSRSGPR